ncbi:hypothetical protein [Acinetobacter radioresistens]|uniref:hypothetical protein n=1 Tax=Acinetobacter radioresistens TaxID=40216 RepID=UPI0022480210|nr:hypothetical protein [Acinetobacter radioresistens]MCX0338278.1 hypothetical protein [Acinetobacter radioresistens]
MPVSEQTPYEEYIANGVSTRFPLGFMCKDSKHLIVKVDDQEALPGEWNLDQQDVVFYTAPKAESIVSIKRNTPLVRTTKYSLYDNSFRPQAINDDMDSVWLKMQELLLEKNLLEIKASKDDDFLKEFLLQVITDAGLQMDQLRELFDSKNYAYDQLITTLKNAINTAAAAGAGAAGWTDLLIQLADGTNLRKFIESQSSANRQLAELSSSPDLTDFYAAARKPLALYAAKKSANSLSVLYSYENSRGVEYNFTTDADNLTRLTSTKIGKTQQTEVPDTVLSVTLNGNFIDNGSNNFRTDTPGDKFSGSFTGTGFKFRARCDINGGLWRFVIDGTITKDISVYSATTIDSSDLTISIPVISGLENKEHSFIATFIGADPAHTPAGGTARGWIKYNATTAVTIPTLTNAISFVPPDNLKSPNLPIVGTGSGGNYYTTVVGDSMSFSFTGTGFAFNHYADSRGGLWRFVIDGTITKDISTFGVGGNRKTEVITGLSNSTHNVTMTFVGQDPANPLSIPRGWYEYSSTEPRTFEVYPRTPKQTEEMLAAASVLEWAISLRPEAQPNMNPSWSPIHSGQSGVSRNLSKQIIINKTSYGSIADVLLSAAYKQIQYFELKQTFTVFNFNDSAGNFPLFAMSIEHKSTNRGSILHKQNFKAVNDIRVMDGYISMLGARTIVDEIESSRFESYKVAESASRVSYSRLPTGMSMKFTDDKYIFITQSKTADNSYNFYINDNASCFTNIRSDAVKTYMQSFKTNSVIKKDYVINNVIEYMATEY